MNQLARTFNSSVGKKLIKALTGLFLCAFLLEHLYGNLLLYKDDGGEAFNEYSHTLVHSVLIRIVEIFLFGAIIFHIIQAIVLTRQNNSARPVKYDVQKSSETSNWFSRNMGITGSVILFFLVIHLKNFFVSYRITGEVTDVAAHVKESFDQGWYSAVYIIAIAFLAFHLNHGFQSAFQTLGLNDKRYSSLLKQIGTGFAILIFIGFSSFPVIFYFNLLD